MNKPNYITGMLYGAQIELKKLYFFQFIQRARIKGFIEACEMALEEYGENTKTH